MNQEQVALSQKEEKPTHVPLQQKIDFDLLFSHREMRRTEHSGTISYKGCCNRPAEGNLDLDFKRKKFEVQETHCGKLFLVHEKGLVEMDKVEKPAPPVTLKLPSGRKQHSQRPMNRLRIIPGKAFLEKR